MKKLLGYLALVVSLVGCAVNIESRMLERGDFVEAYVLNADATSVFSKSGMSLSEGDLRG